MLCGNMSWGSHCLFIQELSKMSVLITTNEPKKIKELFEDRVELPMSFDMMLYTESGKVGIERKQCPGDLLSSVSDGRLNREILSMREECNVSIVLLHGTIRYNRNDTVKLGKRTSYHWTKKGMENLFRTIQYVEGCYLEHAKNSNELVQVVQDLQAYFDKKEHNSLKSRSRIQTNWLVPSRDERVVYFYSGLPGLGITGARKLYERFPSPMQLYSASVEEICEISRMGKSVASGIYNFLRGIVT